ncbi:hypothetical protein MMC10_010379 [Thelotrema lepadinum]|nr:hypothetical protein [Thelotrema lepadinum]
MAIAAESLNPRLEEETMRWNAAEELMSRREQRSRSKADKILGVSESNGWPSQKNVADSRKKAKLLGNGLSFSFADLRDALTGTYKQNQSTWIPTRKTTFGTTATGSDSTSSNPSPTFDPNASTSTLPSTNSSPETPRPNQQNTSSYFENVTYARGNDAVKPIQMNMLPRLEMPSIAENPGNSEHSQQQGNYNLPPLDLPPLSPTSSSTRSSLLFSLSRNKSMASITSSGSDATSRGKWLGRKGFSSAEQRGPVQSGSIKATRNRFGLRNGTHVREWLENADLDRSPSVSGHPLDQPLEASSSIKRHGFSPTSSCTSIRTLTSQLETTSDIIGSPSSQWPLPETKFDLGDKESLHRVKTAKPLKRNLHLESVLSLSSDEESDNENETVEHLHPSRKSTGSRAPGESSSIYTRARKVSDASIVSSVIQLDSYAIPQRKQSKPPSTTGKIVAVHQSPKHTLGNIAVASAGTNRTPFSESKWQHYDEAGSRAMAWAGAGWGQTPKSPLKATAESFAINPWLSTRKAAEQVPMHVADEGILNASVELPASPPLPRSKQAFALRSSELDIADIQTSRDLDNEELDISDFPEPPRSRSNSLVPIIHIELMDDREFEHSRPPIPKIPNNATIVPASSTASRTNSIKSESSTLLTQSSSDQIPSEPQELQGSEVESSLTGFTFFESTNKTTNKTRIALQRTRTISNVPIYVTGLESSGEGADVDGEENIAEFVFSNLY